MKENFQNELTSFTLGKIIKSIYGDKVTISQKRQRGSRYRVYRNLQVKKSGSTESVQSSNTNLMSEVMCMPLERGWSLVQDNPLSASIIYNTSREFNGHRLTYELRISKSKECGEISFEVRSGDRCLNIDQGFFLTQSKNKGSVEKLKFLMDFIKTAKPCEGLVEMESSPLRNFPQVKGTYKDLSLGHEEARVFAKDCLLFCPPSHGAKFCKNCYYLSKQQGKKDKRDLTSKQTNNRYLNKDQLIEKLKTENKKRKSTEVREMYWKEKYENQLIEMNERDSNDLEAIFKSIDDNKVPPDMKYLWEQQVRNSQCSSSKAYRWHPK